MKKPIVHKSKLLYMLPYQYNFEHFVNNLEKCLASLLFYKSIVYCKL